MILLSFAEEVLSDRKQFLTLLEVFLLSIFMAWKYCCHQWRF